MVSELSEIANNSVFVQDSAVLSLSSPYDSQVVNLVANSHLGNVEQYLQKFKAVDVTADLSGNVAPSSVSFRPNTPPDSRSV